MSVSDYDFVMNGRKAVSIAFGETDDNYCSVTLYRESVHTGYKVESIKQAEKGISLDCNWSGLYYVISSEHETAVKLEIVSVDKIKKVAEASISARLVDYKNSKYAEVKNVRLSIAGDNFEKLIKEM